MTPRLPRRYTYHGKPMRTDDFDYALPEELIAQQPGPRGESRLLVLHRDSGRIEHRLFRDFLEYLGPGDILVMNDSRVSARRYEAIRESGAPAEVLLLRPHETDKWEALVKPGRGMKPGAGIRLVPSADSCIEATVIATTEEGGRVLQFASEAERDSLMCGGTAPLPPYIHERLEDEERYQTVYSREMGSAAAPTAGLHFTQAMLAAVEKQGLARAAVTLHVGVDTFRPVRADKLEDHRMHGEWYSISGDAAESINGASERVIAIGTTTVRVLESAAVESGRVEAKTSRTRLFITPGFRFQVVQGLLTNFHLPKSTLLMLVSAFAGFDRVMEAYRTAVRERYRFFSFGDAMLII